MQFDLINMKQKFLIQNRQHQNESNRDSIKSRYDPVLTNRDQSERLRESQISDRSLLVNMDYMAYLS